MTIMEEWVKNGEQQLQQQQQHSGCQSLYGLV
jgi:hypothetical protein